MEKDDQGESLRGFMALLFAVGARREPTGLLGKFVKLLAFGTAVYVLYAATVAILDPLELVAIFFSLMLGLLFLVVSGRRSVSGQNPGPLDCLFSLLALLCGVYFFVEAEIIITRISLLDPLRPLDMAVGTVLSLLTIEATRRTVGLGLTILVFMMVAYNLLGHLIPGVLAHGYISYEHFLDQTIFTTNGVFGAPLRVAATYAFLFVLFGTFLEKCGGADFFFKIAAAISGRQIGGPAKVAVFSSALYGTISGSPTSDVVTTGSITIPMMRRLGYPRAVAGAIEVAASTSGGLIPPIMASAAFIMVEVTGIPYLEIAKAAIIPAFLYLLGVFVQVHFLSRRLNLKPMDADQIPKWLDAVREGGVFVIPLAVLVIALSLGYSISYVAVFGIVSVLAVSLLRATTRLGLRATAGVLVTAALRMVPVTAACAAAGLVVGGISMTGLSGKLALGVFALAGDGALIALILTAAIAILLGMGMPTPSAYIMSAVLTAPILIDLGLPLLNAHFFLLFFAVLSALTPPVAVAAYAASSLAEANPISIAGRAVSLAAVGFVVPFTFAFRPELLGQGDLLSVTQGIATATLGVCCLAVALAGFFRALLKPWQRLLLVGIALLLLVPGTLTDIIGVAAVAIAILAKGLIQPKQQPDRTLD